MTKLVNPLIISSKLTIKLLSCPRVGAYLPAEWLADECRDDPEGAAKSGTQSSQDRHLQASQELNKHERCVKTLSKPTLIPLNN